MAPRKRLQGGKRRKTGAPDVAIPTDSTVFNWQEEEPQELSVARARRASAPHHVADAPAHNSRKKDDIDPSIPHALTANDAFQIYFEENYFEENFFDSNKSSSGDEESSSGDEESSKKSSEAPEPESEAYEGEEGSSSSSRSEETNEKVSSSSEDERGDRCQLDAVLKPSSMSARQQPQVTCAACGHPCPMCSSKVKPDKDDDVRIPVRRELPDAILGSSSHRSRGSANVVLNGARRRTDGWTDDEVCLLVEKVNTYGKKWGEITEKTNLRWGNTQCREKWRNLTKQQRLGYRVKGENQREYYLRVPGDSMEEIVADEREKEDCVIDDECQSERSSKVEDENARLNFPNSPSRKWTEAECQRLVDGMNKTPFDKWDKWTLIIETARLGSRTNVQVKDKWRNLQKYKRIIRDDQGFFFLRPEADPDNNGERKS